MYKVMIVDDEPASLNHIDSIIRKKCSGYEVIAVAENGKEALDLFQNLVPDILITDIKMPVMDGICLVSSVRKLYPDVISVIVSGYQDFEYAKSAMQSGVCDYLLKPLNPSDLQRFCEEALLKLHHLHYEKRNQYLADICNQNQLPETKVLKKYFPAGKYYSAIIRKNGLPRRFSLKSGSEIFSMENEKIYIYGRDQMESMLLIPEALLSEDSFEDMIEKIYQKELNETYFTTIIYHRNSFELDAFQKVSELLYRALVDSIIIGKNQLLQDKISKTEYRVTDQEKLHMEKLAYWISNHSCTKVKNEIETLFRFWADKSVTQLYLEGQIRYIFQLIKNDQRSEILPIEKYGLEFAIDDAFYYAANLSELSEGILQLLYQMIPACADEKTDERHELFSEILAYLNQNISENITLNYICKKFGISQTSLSRLFRQYQDCSFGNYLTKIRMEKAKQIMQCQHDAFIKDVAEKVGYTDQFYFSRIFHSVEGISPSDYLKNIS